MGYQSQKRMSIEMARKQENNRVIAIRAEAMAYTMEHPPVAGTHAVRHHAVEHPPVEQFPVEHPPVGSPHPSMWYPMRSI